MQNDMNDSRTNGHESTEGVPAARTPTPWMTHRAGEMMPDDWMIMADMGKTPNGIQQVSTVARALSIRQTPETTAANAAFIVRAVNSHDALVKACEAAIEYLYEIADKDEDPDEWDLTRQLVTALAAAGVTP